ncbi:hypothetical protein GIB67_020816 [Kingdonia uniflora]|uniref:KOW domain-containing protein n=1 Tax=Kingdonia uniflora TaxID=39325 RepID=A0A7J7M783_9MAGN|nr:hypothetical protein GIB67_020816 [Kingdonia uniflora]
MFGPQEGTDVVKKKAFLPPPRLMNMIEAREMHIRVERRRDRIAGDDFESIDGMNFRNGLLYKTVSTKSISFQNIQPSFDELEKFQTPDDDVDDDIVVCRKKDDVVVIKKKSHFMKGDAVIVVKGDLQNLMGWVEKVDEENVYIRPKMEGLPKTLAMNKKDLCNYFKPGDHVKVVLGVQEGATGMVVKVEGHVLIIVSDITKEDMRVFADNVVESSEVTFSITRIGEYELHDLVLLENMSFGVIIRVESEAFRVLKGIPDRPEVALIKLREIKNKIERKNMAQDRHKNSVSVKDVVKILEGPCRGKQGPVAHIFKGILFICDRHHLEHSGYICAKAQSCVAIGGSHHNSDRILNSFVTSFSCRLGAAGERHRGGRGQDSLIGTTIKFRLGPFKGYRGSVVDVNGLSVWVELDSQMKVVTGLFLFREFNRDLVSDDAAIPALSRETPRYGSGSETPMHPSRTPLHNFMTPMRDPGATPIHDGMRTPMRDQVRNPYTPMSPARFVLQLL